MTAIMLFLWLDENDVNYYMIHMQPPDYHDDTDITELWDVHEEIMYIIAL